MFTGREGRKRKRREEEEEPRRKQERYRRRRLWKKRNGKEVMEGTEVVTPDKREKEIGVNVLRKR